jgi:hypothetical protein
MSDNNKRDRWEALFKVLGFLAVGFLLFVVVVFALIVGACGTFRR